MLRIAGITLPDHKRIEIALTYIYGIGRPTSLNILKQAGIDINTKVSNITDAQQKQLHALISTLSLEGELRRRIQLNIKRLMDIGSYRGMRHKKGLPVRGQRTRTNARTRKGKKKTVANKKAVTK